MEYRDWHIIKTLYEHKNITKAAKSLYMSQPVLTVRLRQIEKQFGVKIVHRGNKGVFFTAEGEYLAQCADNALKTFATIKEQAVNLGGEIAGTLRLGASNYITKYQLPALLKAFKDRYPAVEFKLTTAWSKDVLNLAYTHQIHVGFIRGDYSWPAEKHLLFSEPICIASMFAIDLPDLPDIPRIDYDTDHTIKTLLDNWWRENFTRPPSISMSVNNVDTCKEMILSGLGYALMPARIIADIPQINKLPLTDKENKCLSRNTWMHFQKDALQTKTVSTFINFVKHYQF